MEFTNLLKTSLDLNSRPLRILDEALLPKQEADQTSNFIEKGGNASVQEERGALIEELNRVSAENKKLTEVLTVVCENYSELRNKLEEYTIKNPGPDGTTVSRKRKSESSNKNANKIGGTYNLSNGLSVSCSSDEYSPKKPGEEHIKAKIRRVQVRTQASDTSLVVQDGYLWRKYGQKVTRDNPSPRAYFKCSFAPSCPVKKKVQRSVEDQSIVVATYEGEHNHPHPSKLEANSRSNRSSTLGNAPCPTSLSSSGPTISVDLTQTKPISLEEARSSGGNAEAPEFQQYLVEQMASSLTKDPAFKAALAAAISGKFLQSNQP